MPDSKYAPKHRGAPPKRVRAGATNVVKFSGIAVWATGISVVGGVLSHGDADPLGQVVDLQGASSAAGATSLSAADLAERRQEAQAVSRSADRTEVLAAAKRKSLSDSAGPAISGSEDLTVSDPRALARALMPQYGLSSGEFSCLDNIWSQESGWNVHADNPSSSAYGIPQALPGSKMSSAGPNWQDSAETQIRWGLGYIQNRYGSACGAWGFKQAHGWY